MIKQEKKKTFAEKIEKTKHDPKQQAKILKSIIPNKKNPRETPHTLIYKNKILTDPTEIANAFNDHYITTGQKTSDSIPYTKPTKKKPHKEK